MTAQTVDPLYRDITPPSKDMKMVTETKITMEQGKHDSPYEMKNNIERLSKEVSET